MFGAINGAEFFGVANSCKVSQCSIAFHVGVHLVDVDGGDSHIIRVTLKRFRKFTCAHT